VRPLRPPRRCCLSQPRARPRRASRASTIKELYALDFDSFDLALQLLAEWRLDRHFSAKFRLMDISLAAQDLKAQAGT
jgi:hypothetical protein